METTIKATTVSKATNLDIATQEQVVAAAVVALENNIKRQFKNNCLELIGTSYPTFETSELITSWTADVCDGGNLEEYIINHLDEIARVDEDGWYLVASEIADVASYHSTLSDELTETLKEVADHE